MQKHNGRRAVGYGVAALVWGCVMFFFSGQTGEDSGALSGALTERLFGWLVSMGADEGFLELMLRKAAHMTIFAVEGFLMSIALRQVLGGRAAFAVTAGGCAVLAVLNELHQLTSDGRSCSPTDMLIDFAGALAGMLLAGVILHAFSSKKKST